MLDKPGEGYKEMSPQAYQGSGFAKCKEYREKS